MRRGDTPMRLGSFPSPRLRAPKPPAPTSRTITSVRAISWTSRLDGLIVTGTEPRTPVLTDGALLEIADETHRLGGRAHDIDGVVVSRRACRRVSSGWHRAAEIPEKLSGVFECARAGAAPLLANAHRIRWRIPHSRLNDLPAKALTAAGYQILSTSPLAGADMFIKQRKACLFSCRAIRSTIRIPCCASTSATLADFCAANARTIRRCRTDISIPAPRRACPAFRERALRASGALSCSSDFPAVDLHRRGSAPVARSRRDSSTPIGSRCCVQSRLQTRARAAL